MHAVPQERGYVGFKLTTSTSLNLGDLDLEVSGSGPGHVRNVVPGSSTLGITAPNAFIPTGTTSFLTFYVGSSFSHAPLPDMLSAGTATSITTAAFCSLSSTTVCG